MLLTTPGLAGLPDVAIESPLQKAVNLSGRLGNTVLLKREDLQPVFSFKLRGAYNRMQQLSDAERRAGVIACSAGNHAQGVALAAQRMDIKATIVMPLATPPIKWRNVKRLGATVVLHGADFDEAKKECARLAALHGLTNIPPFDNPYVIAGQGTIGVEILRQAPPPTPAAADTATSGSARPPSRPVDAVFVCVGGGGLAAGIAAYISTYDADAMTRSLRAGHRVDLDEVGLFADGAAVRSVGVETFRVCSELVDEMVLVGTDEICAAIKDIFEDTRSVVEPAGALGVAGCKKYIQEKGLTGGTFVAVCSGANIDFTRLRFVADRADLGEEREALLSVRIPERPGSFLQLYRAVYRPSPSLRTGSPTRTRPSTSWAFRLRKPDTPTSPM
ncbi:hypothetical protein HK405_015011 [Cladochytrium tenue]|nr:hypothetical protein HK405_015011 [Cladochytrium tenue]